MLQLGFHPCIFLVKIQIEIVHAELLCRIYFFSLHVWCLYLIWFVETCLSICEQQSCNGPPIVRCLISPNQQLALSLSFYASTFKKLYGCIFVIFIFSAAYRFLCNEVQPITLMYFVVFLVLFKYALPSLF